MKFIYFVFFFTVISNIAINAQNSLAINDSRYKYLLSEYEQANNDLAITNNSDEFLGFIDKTCSHDKTSNDTLFTIKNLRKMRRHGIGLNGFGPTLLMGSIYYNVFISNRIGVEFGTDVRAYYCGINYYPFNGKEQDKLITPYIGAYINYTTDVYLYEIADAPDKGFKGYFPLGLQIFSQNGFVFSIEAALSFPEHQEMNNIFGAIKLGYQFRKK